MRKRYDMNITQVEFERLLPAAVAHVPVARADGTYSGGTDGKHWRVMLGPEQERRIALIRLPSREVRIELDGYGEAEAEAWLRRFNLYFQKGGG